MGVPMPDDFIDTGQRGLAAFLMNSDDDAFDYNSNPSANATTGADDGCDGN